MDYRLFVISAAGEIARAEEFVASDDARAVEHARRRVPADGGIEVWHGDRKVADLGVRFVPRAGVAALARQPSSD